MVDLADVGLRHRVTVSEAEVVIVSADNDPFVFQTAIRPWERRQNVPNGFPNRPHVADHANFGLRNFERPRLSFLIDGSLYFGQVFSGRLKQRRHSIPRDMHGHDTHIAELEVPCCPAYAVEFVGMVVGIGDKEYRFGAMLAGITRFADEGRR